MVDGPNGLDMMSVVLPVDRDHKQGFGNAIHPNPLVEVLLVSASPRKPKIVRKCNVPVHLLLFFRSLLKLIVTIRVLSIWNS